MRCSSTGRVGLVSSLALALVVVVGFSGCGGGSDEGGEGTTSPAELPAVEGPFAAGRQPIPGFGEVEIHIIEGPDGEPIVLCVLVAETDAQRQRGLMGITDPDLGGYDGMLFVYDEEVEGSFWMKDTPLPLSIAYFDGEGALVGSRDMEPCPEDGGCRGYPAPGPFRRALEVPQGELAAFGLSPGSSATLRPAGACEPARE